MLSIYTLMNNTRNVVKDILGLDTGTKLYRIKTNNNLGIQLGVPQIDLPEPLYSMPDGIDQLQFPVESYATPHFVGQVFNMDNPMHLAYIQECTETFTRELQALKNIDRALEVSFGGYLAIKVIQFFLSTRPYAGHSVRAVALQSMAMNAFNLTDEGIAINALFILLRDRSSCFKNYNDALQRLMHNMAWSLGYQTSANDANALANNKQLMQMVICSSEVLTLKQIQDIIADPIEPTFLAQARAQQNGAGYSARRQANTLALYGTKATNPYYFVTAPLAYTLDFVVQNTLPSLGRLGLFRRDAAHPNAVDNQPVPHAHQH